MDVCPMCQMMTSNLSCRRTKKPCQGCSCSWPAKFSELRSLYVYIYICVCGVSLCVCVSTRTAVTPFRSIAAMASSIACLWRPEEQQQASSIFYYLGDQLPILRVQSRGRQILIPHPWEWRTRMLEISHPWTWLTAIAKDNREQNTRFRNHSGIEIQACAKTAILAGNVYPHISCKCKHSKFWILCVHAASHIYIYINMNI